MILKKVNITGSVYFCVLILISLFLSKTKPTLSNYLLDKRVINLKSGETGIFKNEKLSILSSIKKMKRGWYLQIHRYINY